MAFNKIKTPASVDYDATLRFADTETFGPLLDRLRPLYANGALPRAIDPVSFPDWVPRLIQVQLSEHDDDLTMTLRFFGGTPVGIYGELQGVSASRSTAGEHRSRWLTHAEAVLAERGLLRMIVRGVKVGGKKLDIESLLAPTSSDGHTIDSVSCFGDYRPLSG